MPSNTEAHPFALKNLEGSYNLPNVVAAVAIGAHFGVSEKDSLQALSNYVPSNHRSQSVKTARNWVILDAYNANPSSMSHALNDFASRGHDKPLVILGDMAELGDASLNAHQEVVDMSPRLEGSGTVDRRTMVWTHS